MFFRIHYVDSHSMQHRIIYVIGNSCFWITSSFPCAFELPHLFRVLLNYLIFSVCFWITSSFPCAFFHRRNPVLINASIALPYASNAKCLHSIENIASRSCEYWYLSNQALTNNRAWLLTSVEYSASIFNIFADIAASSMSLFVIEMRFLYFKNLSICVCVWAMFCKKC